MKTLSPEEYAAKYGCSLRTVWNLIQRKSVKSKLVRDDSNHYHREIEDAVPVKRRKRTSKNPFRKGGSRK